MQVINQAPCSAIVAASSNTDNSVRNTDDSVQKTVGVSLSGRPVVDTGKTMAEYTSIAVADSTYTNSINLAQPFLQPSAMSAKSLQTISEPMISELNASLPTVPDVAGFDAQSENEVKIIADKMLAEKSVDITLPDGWKIKQVYNRGDLINGLVVDSDGMPRIFYFHKVTLLGLDFTVSVLRYDIALIKQSEMRSLELTDRCENAAVAELKKLMGDKIFDDFCEADRIMLFPESYMNHESKLPKHVKPVLGWYNQGDNRGAVKRFLGEFQGTESAIQLEKFIEMYDVSKSLFLVVALCEKYVSNKHCNSVYDEWKSNYDEWKSDYAEWNSAKVALLQKIRSQYVLKIQ